MEQTLQLNLEDLRRENENISSQNKLLQQELSKMSQDLVVLQRQDTYGQAQDANTSNGSSSSSSQLLEINRYLRSQKEQLEEKYENLKLNNEITEQKLKSIEGELELKRSETQILEVQLSEAKAMAEASKDESIGIMMMDTNRRLKEECDSTNAEITKLNTEARELEEEISGLKARLSESELKREAISSEHVCMQSEVRRWKERVDNLL